MESNKEAALEKEQDQAVLVLLAAKPLRKESTELLQHPSAPGGLCQGAQTQHTCRIPNLGEGLS